MLDTSQCMFQGLIASARNFPVVLQSVVYEQINISGLILGLHPANERRRYKVTPSLIGWVQT